MNKYPYYTIQEFDIGKLRNLNNKKYESLEDCNKYLENYISGIWISRIYPNRQYIITCHESQYSKRIVEIVNKRKFILIDE